MTDTVIIVQHIHTRWTKASRGGAEALLRNAVPKTARLPQHLLRAPNPFLVCHEVYYDEHHGFSTPQREKVTQSPILPFRVGCVEIRHASAADPVYMTFEYDRQHGGAPDRSWTEKMLPINRGEWGQMIYNGRFSSDEGGWWYEKTVVNVGWFSFPLTTAAAFTRDEPTQRFLAMRHLL